MLFTDGVRDLLLPAFARRVLHPCLRGAGFQSAPGLALADLTNDSSIRSRQFFSASPNSRDSTTKQNQRYRYVALVVSSEFIARQNQMTQMKLRTLGNGCATRQQLRCGANGAAGCGNLFRFLFASVTIPLSGYPDISGEGDLPEKTKHA